MKILKNITIVIIVLFIFVVIYSRITHQKVRNLISLTDCNFSGLDCLNTIEECDCIGLAYKWRECKGIRYLCRTKQHRGPPEPMILNSSN